MRIYKTHNWKKTLIFILGGLFLISITTNLAQGFINHTGFFGLGLPSRMIKFSFTGQGLIMDYPKTWTAFLMPQGNHGDKAVFAGIFAPVPASPDVIMAENSSEGNVLSVAQWGQSRVQLLSSYQSISLSEFDSKYFPAMLREYTFIAETTFGNIEIRCLDYYFLYSHNGYAFSFCADQKNWSEVLETFTEMIQSIKPNE
jgi:hypothetical protein